MERILLDIIAKVLEKQTSKKTVHCHELQTCYKSIMHVPVIAWSNHVVYLNVSHGKIWKYFLLYLQQLSYPYDCPTYIGLILHFIFF